MKEAKTKPNELRGLSNQELMGEVDEHRKALFNLRYQANTEQMEDPARVKRTRREVARILTILRQRELEKTK
jgi:large subunit ribosomal protein L29